MGTRNVTEATAAEAPSRRRGRPPVNREAQHRPPLREPIRQTMRDSERTPSGRIKNLSNDIFWYDQAKQPREMDYQWIRETIVGKPDEKNEMGRMMMNGWTPVPADRHPERGIGFKAGEQIRAGGQILMERPREMTEEAQQEDYDRAVRQVTDNFHRLQLDDKDMLPKHRRDGKSLVKLRKEAPIQVSEGGDSAYEYEE